MNIDITPKVKQESVIFEIGETFRLKKLTFKIVKIDPVDEELTIKVQMGVCEVCGNTFYLRKKGKAKYCSPKCLWRSNSAKHRKKDPEKYNEYQREYMRKRYAEKKAELTA